MLRKPFVFYKDSSLLVNGPHMKPTKSKHKLPIYLLRWPSKTSIYLFENTYVNK